ncbi:PREDICTED: uncharacterized protein LOC109464202 [Branchiostoma belcheri]|uniref:Uncharacterized protein LOC109464202 n=1 Tax=Branchiostoma belcheri TaxID=7741 RepID=A0A6P4XJI8_BRABE|nr:PREDICTED: uncharacterized protein LOC109464202 [Branchiostoma belcheri]
MRKTRSRSGKHKERRSLLRSVKRKIKKRRRKRKKEEKQAEAKRKLAEKEERKRKRQEQFKLATRQVFHRLPIRLPDPPHLEPRTHCPSAIGAYSHYVCPGSPRTVELRDPQREVRIVNDFLDDQHSAHVRPAAIEVALKHNIILIDFPPHSSHFIQPMDERGGPFASLKSKFVDVIQNLNVAKPNFVVTKSSFPRIYRVVRDEGLTMAVVKRGFKNTGIFPANPDRIDQKWLLMNKQPGGAEENGTKDALLSETMEQGPTVSSQELEGRQLLSIEVEMLELAAAASFDQPFSSQSTAPKVTYKTSTNTEASCPSCGGVATSPMLNPLVSAGIIPGYMSDLLTPIRESQARGRRKVTPKAIVFDEEYVTTLKKEAEDKEKEKERQKENKKRERQENKRKRDEEMQKKDQKKKDRDEKKRKRGGAGEEEGTKREEKKGERRSDKRKAHPR